MTNDSLIEKIGTLKSGGALLKRIPRQSRNIVVDECIAVIRQHEVAPEVVERIGAEIVAFCSEYENKNSIAYKRHMELARRIASIAVMNYAGGEPQRHLSEPSGSEFFIPLMNTDKFIIIDNEDSAAIGKYRWYLDGHGYPRRKESGKWIYLHTDILGKKDNFIPDHINRDPLDNKRSNLRFVTKGQNSVNCPKYVSQKATSKYKGVSWCNTYKRWISVIGFNNKILFLGRFDLEEDAAMAYNDAAKKYFGEAAFLNALISTPPAPNSPLVCKICGNIAKYCDAVCPRCGVLFYENRIVYNEKGDAVMQLKDDFIPSPPAPDVNANIYGKVRAWREEDQQREISLLNPDMRADEILLHMGEMTAQEMRTARAAIGWANHVAKGNPPYKWPIEPVSSAPVSLAIIYDRYEAAKMTGATEKHALELALQAAGLAYV